ncbi:MAG: serine--tRNA ligase, partial [Oscillospiraceae bacterium]|nr:serine--tRNA ligase [Oscillospiraceae bacterium]
MIDIKLIRTNPDLVRENIKKKFQDAKLPLVDEVLELDRRFRETRTACDELRAQRNSISKEIGKLMGQKKFDEANEAKAKVAAAAEELARLEKLEEELQADLKTKMMTIPQIIDPSVPIGKDDSENVEIQRYGEAYTPEF